MRAKVSILGQEMHTEELSPAQAKSLQESLPNHAKLEFITDLDEVKQRHTAATEAQDYESAEFWYSLAFELEGEGG